MVGFLLDGFSSRLSTCTRAKVGSMLSMNRRVGHVAVLVARQVLYTGYQSLPLPHEARKLSWEQKTHRQRFRVPRLDVLDHLRSRCGTS